MCRICGWWTINYLASPLLHSLWQNHPILARQRLVIKSKCRQLNIEQQKTKHKLKIFINVQIHCEGVDDIFLWNSTKVQLSLTELEEPIQLNVSNFILELSFLFKTFLEIYNIIFVWNWTKLEYVDLIIRELTFDPGLWYIMEKWILSLQNWTNRF